MTNSNWQKRVCEHCKTDIYIRSEWRAPPTQCNLCKLKCIEDIDALVSFFLKKEEKLKARPGDMLDRAAYKSREDLRLMAKSFISEFAVSRLQAIDFAKNNKELMKLIFRLNKEKIYAKKFDARDHDRRSPAAPPKAIGSFLMGGSPGLGKRR